MLGHNLELPLILWPKDPCLEISVYLEMLSASIVKDAFCMNSFHSGIWHAFCVICECFQNYQFQNIFSGMPSVCQTVWIQIRPGILPGLIWVQTVWKTTLTSEEFNFFLFYMSRSMRFPTMWYVRPAKAQTSLRIRAV